MASQCNDGEIKCTHIEFPSHPQASRRNMCNNSLMKQIRVGGKLKIVPRKEFYYHSIKAGIQKLVSRKGFFELCEHWRSQNGSVPDGMLTDIY